MDEEGTIRLEQKLTSADHLFQTGHHVVIEMPFDRLREHERPNTVDAFFFDTPGVDPDCTLREYEEWMWKQFESIFYLARTSAALFLACTDRKGHSWSKSAVTVTQAFDAGWELFRHYIWMEGVYNRARYPFRNIYALRRGEMPSQKVPVRFKDVVTTPGGLMKETGTVAPIPCGVVAEFLPLFAKPCSVVMDPFAGSGSVMRACHQLKLKSVSVELHPERAKRLRAMAKDLGEDSLLW